jgi:hypothetical protein
MSFYGGGGHASGGGGGGHHDGYGGVGYRMPRLDPTDPDHVPKNELLSSSSSSLSSSSSMNRRHRDMHRGGLGSDSEGEEGVRGSSSMGKVVGGGGGGRGPTLRFKGLQMDSGMEIEDEPLSKEERELDELAQYLPDPTVFPEIPGTHSSRGGRRKNGVSKNGNEKDIDDDDDLDDLDGDKGKHLNSHHHHHHHHRPRAPQHQNSFLTNSGSSTLIFDDSTESTDSDNVKPDWYINLYNIMNSKHSPTGKIVNWFFLFVLLISLVSFTIGTMAVISEHPEAVMILFVIDCFCIGVFTLEYILRVIVADTWMDLLSPLYLVDLVSILPFYVELIVIRVTNSDLQERLTATGGVSALRALRLFGTFRLFKFLRRSTKVRLSLVAFLFVVVVCCFL